MIKNVIFIILFLLLLYLIDYYIIIPIINFIYWIYCKIYNISYNGLNYDFIHNNIDGEISKNYYLFRSKYKNYKITDKDIKYILDYILVDLENKYIFYYNANIVMLELYNGNKNLEMLSKPIYIESGYSAETIYEKYHWNNNKLKESYYVIVLIVFKEIKKYPPINGLLA